MKLITLVPLKEATPPSGFDQFIKKVQDHTDSNGHTEALIEIAKYLKNTKYEKILNHINGIHKLLNNMPSDLSMFRSQIRNELRKEFEKKYGREAYGKLEDAL